MKEIRIDKWLWTVRLFKSRTKANGACKKRKVYINKEVAKPSSNVRVGDVVIFRKGAFTITVKVLALLKNRRGYSIAKDCYEDHTPASEYDKYKNWVYGAETSETREPGSGRPTKKERRELDDYKQALFNNDF